MAEEKPGKPEAPKAAKKAAGPAFQDFTDPELLELIKCHLPESVVSAHSFLGQNFIQSSLDQLEALTRLLKEDPPREYRLLEDITALDYPDREKRFELIYILYSLALRQRLIIKIQIGDGESAPSLTKLWSSANWAEREVYDMFGIPFDGHPDLKRILLPDGWKGHPLRKEYDIEDQDEEWIAKNMKLRAPQSLLGVPSFKEIEHVRDEKA